MKIIQKNKKTLKAGTIAFCLPIILMLVIYWCVGMYPFGDHTVGYGDLANQYVAVMTYFKENFFHPENFLYSFKIALGGNFFPVFAYYLSSPINIISLFFPAKDMLNFFEFNIVFNAGLSGLTMFLYLKNSFLLNRDLKKAETNASISVTVALSTSFALSTFFFNYARSAMWFNAIGILPVVFLGLEKLIKSKKPTLYLISFSFLLLSNYYMGYIVTIFIVICVLFWIVDSLWIRKEKLFTVFLASYRILLYSVLSLMISAIYFLPSLLGQQNVDQEKFKFTFEKMYKINDLWAALFPHTLPTNVPFIFTSLLCLLLLALYFSSKSSAIKGNEKLLCGIFLTFLIFSTWFKGSYMIWHALTMPNGYSNRESFVLVFVIVAVAYRGVQAYLFNGQQIQLIMGGALVVVLAFINLFSTKYFNLNQILIVILFLVLYISCTLFMAKSENQNFFAKWISPVLLTVLVLCDIGYGNYQQTKNLAQNSTNHSSYERIVSDGRKTIQKLGAKDNSFYRVGTGYQINPNDPMQFNYNGVQNYLSQQPTSLTDFLSSTGYFQKHSWLRWSAYNNGSTRAMDSLLGIKYIINNQSRTLFNDIANVKSISATNQMASKAYSDKFLTSGDFNVYRNPTAFPLAFLTEGKVDQLEFRYNPLDDPFIVQNQLFQSIFPSDHPMYTGVSVKQVNRTNNEINVKFISPKSGEGYLYIPYSVELLNSQNVQVFVNGRFVTRAFGNDLFSENGIIALGDLKDNKENTVKIIGKNAGQQYTINPYIAVENESYLQKISQVAKKSVKNNSIVVEGNKIKLNIRDFKKSKNLVLSIPFDKGWQAFANGHELPIRKGLGILSVVHLRPGERNITLKYNVPGLHLGILISLSGIIMSILLITRFKRKDYS